jgi:hypothetical protein
MGYAVPDLRRPTVKVAAGRPDHVPPGKKTAPRHEVVVRPLIPGSDGGLPPPVPAPPAVPPSVLREPREGQKDPVHRAVPGQMTVGRAHPGGRPDHRVRPPAAAPISTPGRPGRRTALPQQRRDRGHPGRRGRGSPGVAMQGRMAPRDSIAPARPGLHAAAPRPVDRQPVDRRPGRRARTVAPGQVVRWRADRRRRRVGRRPGRRVRIDARPTGPRADAPRPVVLPWVAPRWIGLRRLVPRRPGHRERAPQTDQRVHRGEQPVRIHARRRGAPPPDAPPPDAPPPDAPPPDAPPRDAPPRDAPPRDAPPRDAGRLPDAPRHRHRPRLFRPPCGDGGAWPGKGPRCCRRVPRRRSSAAVSRVGPGPVVAVPSRRKRPG